MSNFNVSPMLLKDFYKTDHRRQYPKGTQFVYSNFTPRDSRVKGIDKAVVFGPQYLVNEIFVSQFNENFFNAPKESVVVYMNETHGTYYTRSVKEFTAKVSQDSEDGEVPRFKLLEIK